MFDGNQCDNILNELSRVEFSEHKWVTYSGENSEEIHQPLTHSGEIGISTTQHNLILDNYHRCLQKYFTDMSFGWYDRWHGFTPPKYIKYDKLSEMRNHCDHIHTIFDGELKGIPSLTMVLLLNDDFEGGEFEMFDGQKSYPLKKGEVIIFPSSFLFPHAVRPIIKGIRNSAISWVY